MTEVPLGGGWSVEGVVRVGGTVRRPPQFATQLMREVLVHLADVGFDAAPHWLGLDEQGRDVLTFVKGDTFSDCRGLVWSDVQLAGCAELLQRYHDALACSPLAAGAEVVCHGDFGPWNLIWREGVPIAVIDFDNAHPGDRLEDVAYARRAHLNLGLVDVPSDEQTRRIDVFLRAYGTEADPRSLLMRAYDAAEARCLRTGGCASWPVSTRSAPGSRRVRSDAQVSESSGETLPFRPARSRSTPSSCSASSAASSRPISVFMRARGEVIASSSCFDETAKSTRAASSKS